MGSDSSEGLELRSTHFCEENKRSNTPKPIGPADRKTENYHKTIYTLENHPIVIYIGVVFVKNQTYDTFQVTAYIKNSSKGKKILFQGFLNIPSLQISSEDYET